MTLDANNYKVVSLDLVINCERSITEIEEQIARSTGLKVGARGEAPQEEFVTARGCSYYQGRDSVTERIKIDFYSREMRRDSFFN